MKVAYIVSMFPCWSETFILSELVSHRRAGVDLSVFSLKKFSEDLMHDDARGFLERTEYPYHVLDPRLLWLHAALVLGHPTTYLRVWWTLLRMRAESRTVKGKSLVVAWLAPVFVRAAIHGQVQHLHCHFATYPALLGWIVAEFTGIPYSLTAHAHDIYVNQDLLALVCSEAKFVVTISEFNRRFLQERLDPDVGRKIRVIHCGIDLERFAYQETSQRQPRPVRILSVGRLSGIKGFSYLLDALDLLHKGGADFRCQIIGDGPLRRSLEAQVRQLGIADRVDFLGARPSEQIPGFLKSADVFVLACARDPFEGHDGIPLVFMEAMAYGTPVVGTRLSGIPELIQQGYTGALAEPEDPVSLCEAIKTVVQDPAAAERMRTRARALVEAEFDVAKNARELRTLMADSVDPRGSGIPPASETGAGANGATV